MFFARHVWLFPVVVTLGAVFLSIELYVFMTIPFADIVMNRSESVLMAVAMSVLLSLYIGVSAVWLKKYYYFFKFDRVLRARTEDRRFLLLMESEGTRYKFMGQRRSYTVEVIPSDASQRYVIVVDRGYVWAEAYAFTDVTVMTDSYVGKRSRVNALPHFINERRTFRSLIKALDVPASS